MHLIELPPEDNVMCVVYDHTMAKVRIIVDFTDLTIDSSSIVRINPEPDVAMEVRIMLSPQHRPPSALGATRVTVDALREASVTVNQRPQDNPQPDAREMSVLFCEIARELEHGASYGSAA